MVNTTLNFELEKADLLEICDEIEATLDSIYYYNTDSFDEGMYNDVG